MLPCLHVWDLLPLEELGARMEGWRRGNILLGPPTPSLMAPILKYIIPCFCKAVYLPIASTYDTSISILQLLLSRTKQLRKPGPRSLRLHCSIVLGLFHFRALNTGREHLDSSQSRSGHLTRHMSARRGASRVTLRPSLIWKDVVMIHVSAANDKRKNRVCHLLASVPAVLVLTHFIS